jgi:hypothetical protein
VSVRFRSKAPLAIDKWQAGTTTIGSPRVEVSHGVYEAEATVHAEADTAAELADWQVGFLQTDRVTWNRTYWKRSNDDGQGEYLERKLKVPKTPLRDHVDDAVVWAAPGEFASAPAGVTSADLTVSSSDEPTSRRNKSGRDEPGADASDGTDNLSQLRVGDNFISFVSAHNTRTGEWRHLELVYWSLQTSVDFRPKSGGGIETTRDDRQLGKSRRFSWSLAADQPAVGGTRANQYVNDPANTTRKRVERWS